MKELLLGAHMSVQAGLEQALIQGTSIGCTAIQIFTGSTRQWHQKELSLEKIDLFKETQKKSTVRMVISHASYLINLASPDPTTIKRSLTALEKELGRCKDLSIPYLVLHPGSAVTNTLEKAQKQVAQGLNEVLSGTDTYTTILLETMAGQGTSVGTTFQDLAAIYTGLKQPQRVGFCADTCHLFAAGYNFSTPETYEHMWNTFDKLLGIKNLHTLHINNSKKECGSRVDRHEGIKDGLIPLEAFSLLMNDKRFFDVPKILETPKISPIQDLHNMQILKNLLNPLTQKYFSS